MICHFKELEFISVANFMYLNQIKYKVEKNRLFSSFDGIGSGLFAWGQW
jgi:hypothetical protein